VPPKINILPLNEEVTIPVVAEMTDEAPKTGTGILKVQVKTGNQAIPIEGAQVTVFDKDSKIIQMSETDYDGLARHIIPVEENSHIIVDITVQKDGFMDMNYIDVTIYEGQKSIQSAELVPVIDGKSEITYNET
jgi:hypothetical protein